MHAGLINWVALHKSSLVQKDFQMFTTNILFSATHSLDFRRQKRIYNGNHKESQGFEEKHTFSL